MILRFCTAVWLILLMAAVWTGVLQAGSVKSVSLCRHHSGQAACQAMVKSDPGGHPLALSTAQGYSPEQFRKAYRSATKGALVAGVVVAYHNAALQSDLQRFSHAFGLSPLPACTSLRQMGCLDQLDQYGGRHWPSTDSGWTLEESLDVETLHGQCPGCRIEAIEAATASMQDLLAADDQAVALGAKIVSNSWGGTELKSQTQWDPHFARPGVSFLFSSGDNGYHVSYPAAAPGVIAVGGTTLTLGANGGWQSETVWKGSGSGCSRYEPKPAWQRDTACPRRAVADVAADADPGTGAAVYHAGSWYTVGGTSLAAPLVAGIMASSGHPVDAARLYQRAGFHDIITGKTAGCGSILCQAGRGYDGPTGLGSPSALFGR